MSYLLYGDGCFTRSPGNNMTFERGVALRSKKQKDREMPKFNGL